ncbi:acyltransferase family protein [Paracoccus sediminis]|uniref:Peptidoglycan/LPS O-acetylase OafA/YrhL, contains acyltransferase and SGNH-hydrolase domains n=1 Tax=Paracoccus sediminis TaxID=1214787 RepID=A0A238Y747_9RHOB|nr:Peptidoglycan/LPS O-acetylase OafA/YrhL, contains acyltransferase and SGNH-hydrolase domains [Paracoccus sediminis]
MASWLAFPDIIAVHVVSALFFKGTDSGFEISMAYKGYLGQPYFASLNGLRFFCILAVLWHHSPVNQLIKSPQLLDRGFVGVDFFFVLSGFLITTLLLREERLTGRISLAGFYSRRALRILPAYLLLVTLVSVYWIGIKGQDLLGLVPYYYTFLANFLKDDISLLSVTWSLSVEEQYYMLWPALLIVMPLSTRLRAGVLAGLIGLFLLTMLGLADWLDLPRLETAYAIFRLPGMSYTAILSGSLVAVLLHDPAGFRWLWRICAWRGAPLALFAGLLLYLQVTPGSLLGWPALGMNMLMALCVASIAMREDHELRPVLTFAPVARVGEISYGLYLYHLIGLHIANEMVSRSGLAQWQAAWAVTLVYPLISIALAEASFRGFERYFLLLRSRSASCAPKAAANR